MHPYSDLPDQNFWRRFVSDVAWRDLPIVGPVKFQLDSSSKIATAGSCFAQHIARYLGKAGINTYVTEHPHPLSLEFGGEINSYQQFSARYGNVYTARQCLELFRQAMGYIPTVEDFVTENNRVYDLLRPNAIPSGFSTLSEAHADREFHLACVRKMFETTDVFVFTLGLTESWFHAHSGHTYPVCPGTARGSFEPTNHIFRNLTHADVTADLEALISELTQVNPRIRIILTVSPVPLVASYTKHNVLVASSYSKSVLRAACGEVEERHDHVQYFPSYEIINHVASFGQYLASDLREVSERGVSHVMASFFTAFFNNINLPCELLKDTPIAAEPAQKKFITNDAAQVGEIECEEMFNELIRQI